jgi:putative NADPH-quinone reductase
MAAVLIPNGNPDPAPVRRCAALAAAYAEGARGAGHAVDRLDVGALDFPVLRRAEDYQHGAPCPAISDAQARLKTATHVAMIFPIWLGEAPALFKAFLEQTLRPGFAREVHGPGAIGKPLMTGRSVRIVATMGMPALAYRLWWWDHGLASLRRSVLSFTGFGPIRTTRIGGAGALDPARADRVFARMRALGAAGR